MYYQSTTKAQLKANAIRTLAANAQIRNDYEREIYEGKNRFSEFAMLQDRCDELVRTIVRLSAEEKAEKEASRLSMRKNIAAAVILTVTTVMTRVWTVCSLMSM